MTKLEWVFCPVCGNKIRNQIREDTVLLNFLLYCPKCRQETLISAENLQVTVINNQSKILLCEREMIILDYKETNLNFLYDDLSRKYGEKQAELLYSFMCQKYTDLCKCEMKLENSEMNDHIFKRILPTIGVYMTLIENGFTKEKALVVANGEIQRDAHYKAEVNAKLTKMPFTYSLYKMFAKSHMKKKYPIEGFDVEWKRHDSVVPNCVQSFAKVI